MSEDTETSYLSNPQVDIIQHYVVTVLFGVAVHGHSAKSKPWVSLLSLLLQTLGFVIA